MKPSQTPLPANDPTFHLLATRRPGTEGRQAGSVGAGRDVGAVTGGKREEPKPVHVPAGEPRVLCIMHRRRLFIEHNDVFLYGF